MSIWRTITEPYYALKNSLAEKRSRKVQMRVLRVLQADGGALRDTQIAFIGDIDIEDVQRALFALRDEYDPPRVETVLTDLRYLWRITDRGKSALKQ